MKKKLLILTIVAVMAIMAFSLAGCFGLFSDDDSDDGVYTVQYIDGEEIKQIEVKQGQPYVLEEIPSKTGYEFLGLFDAEVGGNQFVGKNGSSLDVYSEGKGIILYVQWEAKKYTINLDYGEYDVQGASTVVATYDAALPQLPDNLHIEHKIFKGWYTEPDCQGEKVAEQNGVAQNEIIFNESNFNINEEITFYAGFEAETFKVTCYFEDGIQPEEIYVEWNTPVSQIVPETKVDGLAVYSWSLSSNGKQYTGTITENTELYAIDYAQYIEFDVNGGNEIVPLVAKSGSEITLPIPERENYKFVGWYDVSGNQVALDKMPSADKTELTAKWYSMIIFDEKGGSNVQDIAQSEGTTIVLPVPEKGDYMFGGWFDDDGVRYTFDKMPAQSIKLTARWYNTLTYDYDWTEDSYKSVRATKDNGTWIKVDLTKQNENGDFSNPIDIEVKITFKALQNSEYALGQFWYNLSLALYSNNDFNSKYLLSEVVTYPHENIKAYQDREYSAKITVENGIFYVGMGTDNRNNSAKVKNYIIEITYPDTSVIY